jgi:hypothetical protein
LLHLRLASIAKAFSINAEEIVRLYPSRDGFPVKSTRSQFERYMDWWGTERFERDLGSLSLGFSETVS